MNILIHYLCEISKTFLLSSVRPKNADNFLLPIEVCAVGDPCCGKRTLLHKFVKRWCPDSKSLDNSAYSQFSDPDTEHSQSVSQYSQKAAQGNINLDDIQTKISGRKVEFSFSHVSG